MNREEHFFDANGQLISSNTFDVSWTDVRAKRNQLLADTDWRAVNDRSISQAWKDYRTALRDLPQDHDESNDAADNWPVMPDE